MLARRAVEKIRWARRLPPLMLKRRYESDPRGSRDLELCEEVGSYFHRRWPAVRSYADKILIIDQLIHSFHVDEKTGRPAKSVASDLLEGNKKDVVRFLDELSALDPAAKADWRRTTATTIDARMLKREDADA